MSDVEMPDTRGDLRDLVKMALFAGVEATGSRLAPKLWERSDLRKQFDGETMRLVREADAK
jgi:hypothetical protein